MADSTTAVEIFKPLDQDYALTGLRKLFGCMVDQLWKSAGTCSDTSNVLVQGLAWFNGGVLILAGIVACYLLYSLVADTANDGEAFGRSTDTRYTLLRTGIGAGAVPADPERPLPRATPRDPGGDLELGFGDTLWSKIAGTNLTGMYSTPDLSTLRPPDFAVRKTVADALRARTYGYVCKYSLENASKILSGGTTKTINSDSSTDTDRRRLVPERRSGHAPVLSGHHGLLPELDVPVRLCLLHRKPAYDAVGQRRRTVRRPVLRPDPLQSHPDGRDQPPCHAAWSKIDTAANSIAVKVTGGNNPDSGGPAEQRGHPRCHRSGRR